MCLCSNRMKPAMINENIKQQTKKCENNGHFQYIMVILYRRHEFMLGSDYLFCYDNDIEVSINTSFLFSVFLKEFIMDVSINFEIFFYKYRNFCK